MKLIKFLNSMGLTQAPFLECFTLAYTSSTRISFDNTSASNHRHFGNVAFKIPHMGQFIGSVALLSIVETSEVNF